MSKLENAQLARLNKELDKRYRFDEGIMTMREWISSGITHKSSDTQEYSEHKIDLEYKKLASPKTHYTLWKGKSGVEVPKLVWDTVEVPVSE